MHNAIDKRRIGLILPSVNIRMEPEFYRCAALKDFNFYSTRVLLDDTTEETLKAMERDLDHAAKMLATVFPEVVVYACTSGSFISGVKGNSHIIETIKEHCHCPVVTASQAMINSMKELGVRTITLVTPYTDDINEKEKEFFENNGIRVTSMNGLQIVEAETLRTQSVESITDLVMRTDVPESEAIFISCTNVEGLYIAEDLEQKLGKPVVSSNIACLWALLKILGCTDAIQGHGVLLREHL
jgi:maleate cis-trans isomerase